MAIGLMLKWIKGTTDGHSKKGDAHPIASVVETSARLETGILETRTKGAKA